MIIPLKPFCLNQIFQNAVKHSLTLWIIIRCITFWKFHWKMKIPILIAGWIFWSLNFEDINKVEYFPNFCSTPVVFLFPISICHQNFISRTDLLFESFRKFKAEKSLFHGKNLVKDISKLKQIKKFEIVADNWNRHHVIFQQPLYGLYNIKHKAKKYGQYYFESILSTTKYC